MSLVSEEQRELGKSLYDTYAVPLEAKCWGQFVAIAPAGELVVGEDLLETSSKARRTFEGGFYLFKIGERAIGHIR